MATYHFALKQGKVGNAKLHCDYINREGKYARGTKKEELAYKESGNLPHWATSAAMFFDCADVYERANGNSYTEFEVALPNELSLDENIELVQSLVENHIGNNKVYSFAIHEKMATLDENQRQPHAHIMFCERAINDFENVKPASQFFKRYNAKNEELGGYKRDDRFYKTKIVGAKNLTIIRNFWANKINEAYAKNNIDVRVSADTLEAQRATALTKGDILTAEELNRPAQIHLGPKLAGEMKRELQKENFNPEFMSEKAQLVFLAKKLKAIKSQIKERKKYINQLRDEMKEQAAINNALKQEVKADYIDIQGTNLITRIYDSCTQITQKITANNAKIEELKKENYSDKSIDTMALAIYTKNASSNILKGLRKVQSDKEQLQKDIAEFNAKPKPGFFDFAAKEEYNQQKTMLENRKTQIEERESKWQYSQSVLDKAMAKPEHQARFEIVKNRLLLKRASTRKFLDELRIENKELSRLGKELLVVNKTLSRKLHYELPKETTNELNSTSVSQLQNALRSIKQTAYKMRDAKPQGNNAMKIKLHDETRERNEGQDMGF